MKTTGAAVLMSALALVLVGGCAAETTSPPNYAETSQQVVQRTFTLLDRMKAEDLVTVQQHELLRQALVKKLDRGMPNGSDDRSSFYYYIFNKYENLQSLRSLQREGKITQAEFEKIRENVLDLSRTPLTTS